MPQIVSIDRLLPHQQSFGDLPAAVTGPWPCKFYASKTQGLKPGTLAQVETLRALLTLMAPSEGHTAVSPPITGGFSFGRSGQWSGSPFGEDAPLSSFVSPGGFMPNDSASSLPGHRRDQSLQPQRNAMFGALT